MINLDYVKVENKLKVQQYNSELFALIVAKIKEIEGYYVAKITTFPEVPVYEIDSDQVLDWYKKGKLGISTSVTLSKMEQLLLSMV